MKLENQNILIFSNEPWGDVWYSKHNWAFELSKKNNVFFINPPKKWCLKDLFKISITPYTESLKILNYNNLLPFTRVGWLYLINNFITSKRIKKFLYKKGCRDIIFWTFDPYRFTNPKLFSPKFSIYFIADKYYIKREQDLIDNVDYFFSISKVLTDRLSLHKKPLILSHGIAESEFFLDEEIDIEDDYVLYIGNIDYRIDCIFIKKLLEHFPDEKFLFVGTLRPTKDVLYKQIFLDKLYQNLLYHPPVHFKKLKNYIAKAKICLAPMKLDERGNNINHHKLLQYLAQGKQVLSAKFIDYEQNNIIYSYENYEDGVKKLESLIRKKDNEMIVKERTDYAKKFMYERLIEKVEQFLTETNN